MTSTARFAYCFASAQVPTIPVGPSLGPFNDYNPASIIPVRQSMRFCIVSTQDKLGGGEVLVTAMATELRQLGHDVGWIVREGSQVEAQLADAGESILHRTKKRGRNLRDFLRVRRVVRAWQPDVLLMNDSHAVILAGFATILLGRQKPLRLAYKHTVFPLRSKLKYRLLSDKVICVSNAARDNIVKGGIPSADALVVYGGVPLPTESAEEIEQHKQTIRAELSLNAKDLLIVAVGNLLECKGHNELLEAVARLDAKPSFRLVIAGDGERRPALEQLIKSLGIADRVQLLGYRRDANALIDAADFVVHPSRSEGLSLVLIQSLMRSKPIVATAVGGAAEVLATGAECNSAVWVTKPSDVDDLCRKLKLAMVELSRQGSASRLRPGLECAARKARHQFSLPVISKQLADLAARIA